MSDTGASSLVSGLFNFATGGAGQQTAQKLENAGYQQYQAPNAPALNMGAYGADQTTLANAAQINQGQANQFLGGQQGLVAQLQAQAQGSGPDLAQAQLRQGLQANLASQLATAAGQRGNQNPGAAQYALGQGAAAANQAAAGQAAATRAQEQLSAEQGLGAALGQYGSQQIGLAENQAGLNQAANLQNAGAQNAMTQFNTQSAQAGNAAQQAQYQFGTNIAAQQQSNENAAIAGQQLAAQQAQTTFGTGLVGSGLNAAGSALSSSVNSGSGLGAGSSNGGSGTSTANNWAQPPPDDSGGGGGDGGGDNAPIDTARGTVGEGRTHRVGEAGPEAVVKVPESHVHVHMHGAEPGEIKPGQVVAHDVVGQVGHEGSKTAIVPLHEDGSPKVEAMKSNVKELLDHPEFKKAVAKVVHKHLADALKERDG
jgi:hypothetical protein